MIRWPFSRTAQQALVVQDLGPSHLRACADIHADTFQRPWTDGDIEQLLGSPGAFGLVARSIDHADRVVGFVLARQAVDEMEILTVAVKRAWQGYGAGRMLMDEALRHGHHRRAKLMFLEVDETNDAAINLYRKLGFEQIGTRPNYYSAPSAKPSAALIMRRDL